MVAVVEKLVGFYCCWFVAWCWQLHRDALYICLIGTFWLALCGLLVCGMLLADALEMPTGRGDPDSCPAGLTTCHSQLCNVYNS